MEIEVTGLSYQYITTMPLQKAIVFQLAELAKEARNEVFQHCVGTGTKPGYLVLCDDL